jgi:hypothetical protein
MKGASDQIPPYKFVDPWATAGRELGICTVPLGFLERIKIEEEKKYKLPITNKN